MADDQGDYKVSPGRPPLHTRFRKRQSLAAPRPAIYGLPDLNGGAQDG